MSNMTACCG